MQSKVTIASSHNKDLDFYIFPFHDEMEKRKGHSSWIDFKKFNFYQKKIKPRIKSLVDVMSVKYIMLGFESEFVGSELGLKSCKEELIELSKMVLTTSQLAQEKYETLTPVSYTHLTLPTIYSV